MRAALVVEVALCFYQHGAAEFHTWDAKSTGWTLHSTSNPGDLSVRLVSASARHLLRSLIVHYEDIFASRFCVFPLLSDACTSSSLQDRKSTRLNSSHLVISYAVFC